jgi:hypothetical protein
MKKIIISILLVMVFSTIALAQGTVEKKGEIIVTTMITALPAHCAPTKEIQKVFTAHQLIFTGLVDKANVFKIFLNKNGAWSSMLENVSGISCVHFSGVPAMLTYPKVKENGT